MRVKTEPITWLDMQSETPGPKEVRSRRAGKRRVWKVRGHCEMQVPSHVVAGAPAQVTPSV